MGSSQDNSGANEPTIFSGRDRYSDYREVNLYELFRVVFARKWIVLGIVLAFGLGAALVSLLITPVYRVDVLLAPSQHESSNPLAALSGGLTGIAALAGVGPGSNESAKNEAIATLTSRKFTEAMISDEGLLPVLFSEKWDSNLGEWKVADDAEIPSLLDGYKRIRDDVITIDEDSTTGLVTLSIEWPDPEVAVSWANLMVSRLNLQMRERAKSDSEESIKYLQKELAKTSIVEIRQSIFGLLESEYQTIVFANVRDDFSFRTIDPAAMPDDDDYVWPKTTVMVFVFSALGLMVGVLICFILQFRDSRVD